MSISKPTNRLPTNVVFFPDAKADFLALDRTQQVRVIKALQKIAQAPAQYGKLLGNKQNQLLAGFRSIYVDKKALRIVWRVAPNGDMEVAIVAGIAEREDSFVYRLVSSRRSAVEAFIEQLRLDSDMS